MCFFLFFFFFCSLFLLMRPNFIYPWGNGVWALQIPDKEGCLLLSLQQQLLLLLLFFFWEDGVLESIITQRTWFGIVGNGYRGNESIYRFLSTLHTYSYPPVSRMFHLSFLRLAFSLESWSWFEDTAEPCESAHLRTCHGLSD